MQAQEELAMIKGKRSKRPRLASSSSTAELSGANCQYYGVVSESSDSATPPSPSNSGDLTQSSVEEEEEKDMANCLILLANGSLHPAGHTAAAPPAAATENYKCKTCCKSFPSFQALGGHSASHKKSNNKPILAVDELIQSNGRDDGTIISLRVSSNKSRVHECSICGAEFASGQALGGHMRRHRALPPASSGRGVKRPRNILSLDLNLPAPEDDQMETNKFQFPAKEHVIVFSASPLVGCHY
ncbi:hypothetical protein CASFOL_013436 [Castilleja foliolosa]|uniref:C2H2-type domain-containing protein n=1 Tax=Castilleja foliolosa TaxID=1961234 RepID=A0ABD3DK00_9LAMI